MGDLLSIEQDSPLFGEVDSGDTVQQGALASAVTPDDGYKFTGFEKQVDLLQCDLFIDLSDMDDLVKVFYLQHLNCRPFLPLRFSLPAAPDLERV